MAQFQMMVTDSEAKLVDAIRRSGQPIEKVANELMNVHRNTDQYDTFAKAYNEIVGLENAKK
jgi:hypothetical protein